MAMPEARAHEARELARQAGEYDRRAHEHRREANERLADNSRVHNEEGRVTKEAGRGTAEDDRAGAEGHRVADETDRSTAEGGRSTTEGERTDAEGGRMVAERERVKAEDRRVLEAHQPIWVPRTKLSALYAAFAVFLASATCAGLPSFYIADRLSRVRDDGTLKRRIETCERTKLDRIDNARAWTQATKTWSARAGDKTVSPSERKLAERTATSYQESADGLGRRLFLCKPLTSTGREVVDQSALREALGN